MNRWTIGLLVLFTTDVASAMVMRHDRESAQYEKLAARYPMVCEVGGGTGTLIAPDAVLTAAHVAPSVKVGGTLDIAGHQVEIAAIHTHPDYRPHGDQRDLAILRLATPVLAVTPARLPQLPSAPETPVIFVGNGYPGTGDVGFRKDERVFRAAQNRIERVTDQWLVFVFDAPPAGEELEGISGPGDSGGPALVEREDGWEIVGVSGFNDGEPPCHYGSSEYYARVAPALPWIQSVLSRGD